MSRLLIFHPALAPYRLDFFNALGKMFDCKVVFLQRQNNDLLIQQQELLKNATFRYEYLDQHFKLFGRDIECGLLANHSRLSARCGALLRIYLIALGSSGLSHAPPQQISPIYYDRRQPRHGRNAARRKNDADKCICCAT